MDQQMYFVITMELLRIRVYRNQRWGRNMAVAINYHAVREAAVKILRVGKEDGMTNLSDLFPKVLTADRQRALCSHITH